MLKIDIYWLIASYLSLSILVFFFFELKRIMQCKNLDINPDFIWHCSVCTHTYIDTHSNLFSICPRCGYYNKK